jgi:hypothetical protein
LPTGFQKSKSNHGILAGKVLQGGCPADHKKVTAHRTRHNQQSEVRTVAIHPSSSFPLRVSDQADVIRIYLELLRDRYRAGHTIEDLSFSPLTARNDSRVAPPSQQLPDLD